MRTVMGVLVVGIVNTLMQSDAESNTAPKC
jgi:hypothetical protein